MIAAGLREIAAGNDSEFDAETLQEHGHQVGKKNYGEQRVVIFRASGQVGCPVAGIHVADGNQKAGTGKRQQFPQPSRGMRHRHGAVHFGQTWPQNVMAPGSFFRSCEIRCHIGTLNPLLALVYLKA